MKHKSHSAIAALLIAMLLPYSVSAQLQWFGYAGGGTEAMLDRTTSYINFGYFITDSNAGSQNAAFRINGMAQRNMKAIVELGQLLWNPNSSSGPYNTLYNDYATRWNTWKKYNSSVLTSDKILGFLIRDEPFSVGVNISQWEVAARMVKQDFPWAKIMLIEAAVTVNDPNPSSSFNQNFPRIQTVDWVGLDRYSIDPTTDLVFRNAVTKMKQSFPGRKFIYVADGWWNSAHASAFGNNILVMRDVMTKWYDVARNDPDAVLLGVFIWDTLGGEITIGSDNFPAQVIDEHIRVGRAITGRTRPRLFQPVGVFEGYDLNFNAVGWACDPDSPWGEKVYVDFYEEGGGWVGTLLANQPSEVFPQCTTGTAHRFRGRIAGFGRRVIAVARDLDSGVVQLPSTCADAPACVAYFNDYAPIGEFKISSTGFAEGWTCDPDAPQASLKVEVWMDSTAPNGTIVATTRANLTSDETINGQCGGGTAHRFGVQLPSGTKGHAIYIYGIDTMVGSSFLLTAPDSGCQAVGACIW